MRTAILTSGALTMLAALAAAQEWQPVEGQIMSRWVEYVNLDAPWPEYPRPQMVRDNWTNLNVCDSTRSLAASSQRSSAAASWFSFPSNPRCPG